jgi:anti-anti-sigma factor
MKTQITVQNDCTIVELSGYIDFEAMRPLAQSIEQIYKDDAGARVVINLRGLSFVGSSGISSFVKTLRVFNRLTMKPSYCGMKSEFQRMFRLFEDQDNFEIFESEEEARKTAHRRFEEWQTKTLRSKSTH